MAEFLILAILCLLAGYALLIVDMRAFAVGRSIEARMWSGLLLIVAGLVLFSYGIYAGVANLK